MNHHAIHRRDPHRRILPAVLLSLLLAPCLALAQTPKPASSAAPTGTALPAWDSLTPAQRELLIAPIRERWNDNPGSRVRMYEHAQRWKQMPPEQRARARHGQRRWEKMSPEQREQMRALYHQMRGMDKEQRDALRQQWHDMSDAQRRAWVQSHPPAKD